MFDFVSLLRQNRDLFHFNTGLNQCKIVFIPARTAA